MRRIVYGPGGFDPAKRNNNIIEIVDDDGAEVEPTVDDRLAAIEQAITNADDFAALKADLASSDASAVT